MELRDVDFYGDSLTVIKKEEHLYVQAKQVATHLGLSWEPQLVKLKEHPILSEGIRSIVIPSARGNQEALALRVDLVPSWLFMVSANKVKSSVREKLIRYQRDAANVLSAAFVPPQLKSDVKLSDEFDLLSKLALNMRDEARRREQLSERVNVHEARLIEVEKHTTGVEGFKTVLAYAKQRRINISHKDAIRAGKLCAALCKTAGIKVGKAHHAYYGTVNTWPEHILSTVFDQLFGRASP